MFTHNRRKMVSSTVTLLILVSAVLVEVKANVNCETFAGDSQCCTCYNNSVLNNNTCIAEDRCPTNTHPITNTTPNRTMPNCSATATPNFTPYSNRICGCKNPHCEQCSSANLHTCLACEANYFLQNTSLTTDCTRNCASHHFKNYKEGTCDNCQERLNCEDCHTVSGVVNLKDSCIEWCVDYAPIFYNEHNQTKCYKCNKDDVKVSGCDCCVKECPSDLVEIDGFCEEHWCGPKYMYCIIGGVVGALLVVVVLILLCCYLCRRNGGNNKVEKPTPLPSAADLERTDSHLTEAAKSKWNPGIKPPIPHPRKENEADYEMEATSSIKPHINGNIAPPHTQGSRQCSTVDLSQVVPEPGPEATAHTPTRHKGYINQEVIDAHEAEQRLDHSGSGVFDNNEPQQELYVNTVNPVNNNMPNLQPGGGGWAPQGTTAKPGDYINMNKPEIQEMREKKLAQLKPESASRSPLLPPKPGGDGQELYLDMTGKRKKPNKPQFNFSTAVEAPDYIDPVEDESGQTDYYNVP